MPMSSTDSLPNTHVEPDPALEKRLRRTFTTEQKLRIIAEADQCKHGELGPLLRREKIYHGQLQTWRQDLAVGGEEALSKSLPGPKPKQSVEQKRIEQLEKEIARLSRDLSIAEDCISLQKKLSNLIEQSKRGSDS